MLFLGRYSTDRKIQGQLGDSVLVSFVGICYSFGTIVSTHICISMHRHVYPIDNYLQFLCFELLSLMNVKS